MAQELFPIPSPSPSRTTPRFWPGINRNSTDVLRDALKENHNKWHVFFDPRGFHNHAAHYVITLWSLGADASVITAAYKLDCEYQRPAFKSPEPITVDNFKDHLGDDNYYGAYLEFFADVVRTKGPATAVEEYVFDLKANFDLARSPDKQPEMLNRFCDAAMHPMIHVGYGFEFGLPGMVVEGLASTAVHQASSSAVIPRSFFESTSGPLHTVTSLTSRLSSALYLGSKGSDTPSENVHAFTILARILKDSRFDGGKRDDNFQMIYANVMDTHGEALKKHASEWTVNISDPREVERKIEELVWTAVIIYGIAGWEEGANFNADFFHLHVVTSSLFLSSIAAELKPSSQELLLRGYFVVILGWWVGRGRPGFNIPAFFAADTAYPTPPGPLPIPSEKTLPSQSSPVATTPNPWLPILQTAIVHPDDHLPKLQRSLAHYGSLYGLRAPGQADFSNTELPDAEKLDGTLFLRVAGLTAKRVGRVREGEEPLTRYWDRQGFYKE